MKLLNENYKSYKAYLDNCYEKIVKSKPRESTKRLKNSFNLLLNNKQDLKSNDIDYMINYLEKMKKEMV